MDNDIFEGINSNTDKPVDNSVDAVDKVETTEFTSTNDNVENNVQSIVNTEVSDNITTDITESSNVSQCSELAESVIEDTKEENVSEDTKEENVSEDIKEEKVENTNVESVETTEKHEEVDALTKAVNEIKEEEKKKKKIVFWLKLVFFITLIGVVIGVLSFAYYTYRVYEENTKVYSKLQSDLGDSSVLDWLNMFVQQSYLSADSFLGDDEGRIYNTTFFENVKNEQYYETAIDKISGCIQEVSVDSILKGEYNGQCVYTLNVVVKPYVKITSLKSLSATTTYKAELEELKQKCLTNSISEYEYRVRVEDLLYKIYADSCFQVDTTNPITLQLSLAQQQNLDGGIVIYGVKEFMQSVISNSNIENNINVYETEISTYIKTLTNLEVSTEETVD